MEIGVINNRQLVHYLDGETRNCYWSFNDTPRYAQKQFRVVSYIFVTACDCINFFYTLR